MTNTPAKSTPPAMSAKEKAEANKNDDAVKSEETVVSASEEAKKNEEKTPAKKENAGTTVKNDIHYSDNVVALQSDKTPAEMAMETPDETAERYKIDTTISDEDADNPRVQVYHDTLVKQVPSGTHLHPDIAKDYQNRGIVSQGTDNAEVKRTITDTHHFADSSPFNDKGVTVVEDDDDNDDDDKKNVKK